MRGPAFNVFTMTLANRQGAQRFPLGVVGESICGVGSRDRFCNYPSPSSHSRGGMIYGSIGRSVLARFRMMENIFTTSALPLYILTFRLSKKWILMNPIPRYTLSISAYSLTILTPN